jgi:DNA-binding NarL/FixJ family response regulator
MSNLRILIADDHELVRRGVRGILQAQRGWKVINEAADGGEALEKARKSKPDVVIVDIGMPNLDGLEATRQIAQAAPQIRILVLTMHESDHMVRRVFEAGALGYVLKSDLAANLVKAVKAVSQGKQFLTPKVSEIVLQSFLNAGKEAHPPTRLTGNPTPRELEIIRLLVDGKTNKEIAAALGITVRTVETHRANIMLKLGVHSISELIRYATRHDLHSAQRHSSH